MLCTLSPEGVADSLSRTLATQVKAAGQGRAGASRWGRRPVLPYFPGFPICGISFLI